MAYTTIDNPAEHFVTTLWTGDGGARTITGLEFKPDLIWSKTRSKTYNHMISDSSRGFNANSELASNTNGIEGSFSAETYGYKSGHTSDGWTMVDGTDDADDQEDGNTNEPSVTYVAWSWKANGGTTSSNTSGTITSTVQANTTAGFSIVAYVGAGASTVSTIGHSLGAIPDMMIVKSRTDDESWMVYHQSSGNGKKQYLDLSIASATSGQWDDTTPTSTLFTTTGDATNDSGDDVIAYCFTSIQGYSKFGSYTGNGNDDGPFVYLGFKPAFVLWKNTSGESWVLTDNARSPFNLVTALSEPDTSIADATVNMVDYLSNGYKIRDDDGRINSDDVDYIYMAFAEQPFVTSGGVPCTAR